MSSCPAKYYSAPYHFAYKVGDEVLVCDATDTYLLGNWQAGRVTDVCTDTISGIRLIQVNSKESHSIAWWKPSALLYVDGSVAIGTIILMLEFFQRTVLRQKISGKNPGDWVQYFSVRDAELLHSELSTDLGFKAI